ncbi:MAG TPA: hypothetical protein VH600_03985 [Burkholderiales bacterium]|jgi:hypothetical protein
MIAKVFGTAAAIVLLGLGASCSYFSKSGSTSASTGGTGASGPAEMGRGRCEALTGPERDKCFAEDRVQRSDERK